MSYNDPVTFFDLFKSANTLNISAYNNPAYDAALAEASTAVTPEERFAALHRAEDILFSEDAFAPLVNFSFCHLIQDNITGVEFRPIQIFSLKHAQLK